RRTASTSARVTVRPLTVATTAFGSPWALAAAASPARATSAPTYNLIFDLLISRESPGEVPPTPGGVVTLVKLDLGRLAQLIHHRHAQLLGAQVAHLLLDLLELRRR